MEVLAMRCTRLLCAAVLALTITVVPATPAAGGVVHAKKKKKPNRGPKGPRGPKGATGPKGDPGAPGAAGANGATGATGASGFAIVARVRGSGATGTTNVDQPVTLTGNTWSQPAGETDWLVGTLTITPPATCGGGGTFTITFTLDGSSTAPGAFVVPPPSGGPAATVSIIWLATITGFTYPLFEPDAATPHTITMTTKDTCSGAAENYTINAVKIDVLGQS